MSFDPKLLGWYGAMKAAINALIVVGGAVVCVVCRPSALSDWLLIFGAAFALCGLVEWIFRGWMTEQVAKLQPDVDTIDKAVLPYATAMANEGFMLEREPTARMVPSPGCRWTRREAGRAE